jgi:hypothetical protein
MLRLCMASSDEFRAPLYLCLPPPCLENHEEPKKGALTEHEQRKQLELESEHTHMGNHEAAVA